MLPNYQKFYLELAKNSDIDLTVLVPKFWQEGYKTINFIYPDNLPANVKFLTGRVTKPYRSHRSIFYKGLLKAVKSNKPDIIFANVEPETLFAFQTILVCFILNLQSKLIFYTFRNIDRIFYKFTFIYRFTEKISLRKASIIFAANNEAIQIFKRKGYNNIVHLTHGIDSSQFHKVDDDFLRKELRLNGFVLGYVGRLVREKGVSLLLKALCNLPEDIYALIIGSGPDASNLKSEVELNGLSHRVVFIDAIPNEELPLYLSCMDVLVAPSLTTERWKEQFGRVLIEAMACEVCVVGSSSGAISEVIGDAGLVFKEQNVDDLEKKIRMLINNKNLRKDLARKGRERVLKNYSWEKIAEKTYQIYKELCS